jgi:hypothetical protein
MQLDLKVLVIPLTALIWACAKPSMLTPGTGGPETLVQSLTDPRTRDAAYCQLLGFRRYHRPAEAYPETCGPVTEIVKAPQAAGPPLYIVFTNPGYKMEREPVRRRPVGPFTIVDGNGYIVPVFSNANMVIYESEVFASSPRGEIAVGHVIGTTRGSAFDTGHWSVQTLHIVPTAISQKPALSVVIGPPTFGFDDECAGNFWTWRYRDVDADGFPEIEIGPRADAAGKLKPAAMFRWSEADQKYIGPGGSIADQFLQFRPEDRRTAFDGYAEAWRSMRDKRTGYRLSWCSSVSGVPSPMHR